MRSRVKTKHQHQDVLCCCVHSVFCDTSTVVMVFDTSLNMKQKGVIKVVHTDKLMVILKCRSLKF